MSGGARYRDLPLGGSLEATLAKRDDGSTLVVSKEALQPYAARLTDRFLHWAEAAPDRTLVAKRVKGGDWRRVSYAEALAAARAIAQWLLAHPLSVERPIAILSDNDIEHLLLALADPNGVEAHEAALLGGVRSVRRQFRKIMSGRIWRVFSGTYLGSQYPLKGKLGEPGKSSIHAPEQSLSAAPASRAGGSNGRRASAGESLHGSLTQPRGIALSLANLFYALIGCLVGTLIGVLPGSGWAALIRFAVCRLSEPL
jgi:hypothetical protein